VDATASIGDTIFDVSERLNHTMAGFQIDRELAMTRPNGEKRDYPRAQNSLRVNVQHDQRLTEGVCRDISLSGLQLILGDELATKQLIDLEVFLPTESIDEFRRQSPLRVKGRVMWARPDADKFLYGIHFESLDEGGRQALKRSVEYFNHPAVYQ